MTADATNNNNAIKYVYLEMILDKDTKYDVVSGLFSGIAEDGDKKFILLKGLKNSTNVLSLEFYSYMTIEVCEGDFRNYSFLNCDKSDQDIASGMIDVINKRLLDDGFGLENDPKVIDTDKYSEVPDDYREGKPLVTGSATSGTASGVGNFAGPSRYQKNQHGIYNKQPVIKPDPTPSTIERTKDNAPSDEDLALMLSKVEQIRDGVYEAVMPHIMGEDDAGFSDNEEETDYYSMYNM